MQANRQQKSVVFEKLEEMIFDMSQPDTGVCIRQTKGIFSPASVINSFAGRDLVKWLQQRYDIREIFEAQHLVYMLCQHGFIYPVSDRQLLYKAENLYRFQKIEYWPSRVKEVSSVMYAEYLMKKRLRNRAAMEYYESMALNTLRATLPSSAWQEIEERAMDFIRRGREITKESRDVQIGQEKAFWRVHRPPPDVTSPYDKDIMKSRRSYRDFQQGPEKVALLKRQVQNLTASLTRTQYANARPVEWFVNFHNSSATFDPQFNESPNPWFLSTMDNPNPIFNSYNLSTCQVHRWTLSIDELLKDPFGRQFFKTFLNQEYSGENLLFWQRCQRLKEAPKSDIEGIVKEILREHLEASARSAINIDAKIMQDILEQTQGAPHRYMFDEAQKHILYLMKESYGRFLKSDVYGKAMKQGSGSRLTLGLRGFQRKKSPIKFERKGSSISLEESIYHRSSLMGDKEGRPSLQFKSPSTLKLASCDPVLNNNDRAALAGFPMRKAESMSSVAVTNEELDSVETVPWPSQPSATAQ